MQRTDFDGFYSALLTGVSGQGFIMLVLARGKLVGVDPLGVTFDGTYTVNDAGQLEGRVTVKAPPDGTLIQGQSTGPAGLAYEVPITLSHDFTQVPFIRLETPMGPVNIKLKKLRDLSF